MAARSVSPGGALLRASRVFAIPSPLPQPEGDLSSTAIFSSDSATLPHPIHLSIATPRSSFEKGDWGFKRPLPLRPSKKTAFLRVTHIDTYEHITDFDFAADHSLNVQRWQMMGIPLSLPPMASSMGSNFPGEAQSSGKTVFEDKYDTIAPADGTKLGKDDVRWKFRGPWLAGLTEGQFNAYVRGEVRKRKDEFRRFLRNACAVEITQTQRRIALEEGTDLDKIPPNLEASDVVPEQLTEYIKALRKDTVKLNQHIRTFLDLPPAPSSNASPNTLVGFELLLKNIQTTAQSVEGSDSPYAESGPPKTHPSAGLSYSRSSSYLFNHPIYGPQKNPPPVLARVVKPRASLSGSFAPVLGVGGFVTRVPVGAESFNMSKAGRGARNAPAQIPGLMAIEPDRWGGSKSWVQPKHARIDAKGKVFLSVVVADRETVAVHTNTVGDIPNAHQRYVPQPFSQPSYTASSNGSGYGLKPRDTKRDERNVL